MSQEFHSEFSQIREFSRELSTSYLPSPQRACAACAAFEITTVSGGTAGRTRSARHVQRALRAQLLTWAKAAGATPTFDLPGGAGGAPALSEFLASPLALCRTPPAPSDLFQDAVRDILMGSGPRDIRGWSWWAVGMPFSGFPAFSSMPK